MECISGKLSVLSLKTIDGTAFENIDIESV